VDPHFCCTFAGLSGCPILRISLLVKDLSDEALLTITIQSG
jgi:hypothetical protein